MDSIQVQEYSRRNAAGDQYSDDVDAFLGEQEDAAPGHPLDSDEAKNVHKRLLEWYYLEREKQSENRMQMAMDADFYDNIQWDPEDAAELKARGQMPLVFNEVAPMVDWIIGTERRTRVDWSVLPRAEDDVKSADIKTKVLKYVSDINRVPFARSRAFADAAKVGVGWVDDGARDDPTQDILYSKYEDWRNVIWDSSSYELDLSDARYLFRWRWVDEDVALAQFQDRRDQVLSGIEDTGAFSRDFEEDSWRYNEMTGANERAGSFAAFGSTVSVDAKRRRIRLIEAQFRMPAPVKIVVDGPFKGAVLNPADMAMSVAVAMHGSEVVDRVMMRMHVAVFTETDLLSLNPSAYRHNRFSLTPIWCYRRGRDRLPYGVIRRVRDIQQDLNKRASKALFMLNTNQIIADKGAVDDPALARDEADRPDGYIEKSAGKEFTIRRDTDGATGQIQMMQLDASNIQKSAGVSQENLGRPTNAVSGEAIKARQLQGSVVTTEPFDNLRLAVQVQGEKQLSLTEQFYTEQKVIRLTGARGALEWVKVNQPEEQPDGSVRYINDITASQADFVVAEQDYAGTLRQVMFDSLNQIVMRLPPEVGLRMFTIAMEFSDLPNKDEIADAIRRMTGDRDPNKEMTPEEIQQAQAQAQQQAEVLEIQRQTALNALEEQRAKVRELNARAMELEARAQTAGGGVDELVSRQVAQIRAQADQQIEALAEQLRKAQSDSAVETLKINRSADTALEAARIDADAKVRVAEISDRSDARFKVMEQSLQELSSKLDEAMKRAESAEKAAAERPEPEPAETQAVPAAPAMPQINVTVPLTVSVDAKPGTVKKTLQVKHDADGNIVGGEVIEQQDEGQARGS